MKKQKDQNVSDVVLPTTRCSLSRAGADARRCVHALSCVFLCVYCIVYIASKHLGPEDRAALIITRWGRRYSVIYDMHVTPHILCYSTWILNVDRNMTHTISKVISTVSTPVLELTFKNFKQERKINVDRCASILVHHCLQNETCSYWIESIYR